MTDSVTPRAPDPPLVDPETGETKPLSPPLTFRAKAKRKAFIYPEWDEYERDLAAHVEPDDAA